MARTQAVNQQKKAAAASNTTAATSTAPAAAAALRTSAKRSPAKPSVTSDPATKKTKILKAPAAESEKSPEKEIEVGKAGKEIATVTVSAAETELFSETDSTLEDFFLGTEEAGQSDAPVDITPVAEIPTEIEGSSGSLVGKTYNLRTRHEKQPQLEESGSKNEEDDEESGSDDEDEDDEDEDEESGSKNDEVAKKREVTPTKIHQNVARLKGSGNRGRPIVPVSPSGTIELSF